MCRVCASENDATSLETTGSPETSQTYFFVKAFAKRTTLQYEYALFLCMILLCERDNDSDPSPENKGRVGPNEPNNAFIYAWCGDTVQLFDQSSSRGSGDGYSFCTLTHPSI